MSEEINMTDQPDTQDTKHDKDTDQIPNSESSIPNSKRYLFDNPRNFKILLWSFYSSLLVLIIIEFFVHKHPHFPWEDWPEFYAVYGFVACVALVLAAKYILRPLMRRREDYYD